MKGAGEKVDEIYARTDHVQISVEIVDYRKLSQQKVTIIKSIF